MGWWQVNADTLAGSRFVVSPLAEATASLKALERRAAAHPGERAWLDAHLADYRGRLAADPVTALLIRAALGRNWIADFLTPTPGAEREPTFEREVVRVREASPEVARTNLTVSLGGPLPDLLHRSDLPRRAAELLEWVWTETVLPYWPQRRRVLEADIVARTAELGQGGWAGSFDTMRPGMRWLGDGRLQINGHDYPPREISGAQLLFAPVTPRQGWVSWDPKPTDGVEPVPPPAPSPQHRYAVVYPCAGTLAEAGHAPKAPKALAALLGPGRAAVLVLLASPKSTTQLVALTGQGLGSVGRHLKVLHDSGLVRRRRSGRSVLYYRSDAGDAVVSASGQ
ncbi:ArsR family transcriptional regulator [Streptacidiphilus carbonis]|uniref:ArsR family transcriptional regulator n=1 Tax=Streptacidiphilus carbonis TaxID=105422 RepID=UPI0005A60DBF|nr:ArsR family transcriptional regulator [Streptacidiphilus carbonis]